MAAAAFVTIVGGTIGEDVITAGVGVADDIPSFVAALAAAVAVFAS